MSGKYFLMSFYAFCVQKWKNIRDRDDVYVFLAIKKRVNWLQTKRLQRYSLAMK